MSGPSSPRNPDIPRPMGGPRVVLGHPAADADASAAVERAGLTVVATAATAGLLKRQVGALRPDVALLHAATPHADAALVASLARAGIPTVLLVDAGLRRSDDLLAGPPYPPYVLAQAERLGCVGVAAWPPVPDELLLRAEQAAEHAHLLVQADPLRGARSAATGGTLAFVGEAGGTGKTQLAANLAAYLGVVCERRVALADLDLLRGSLHDALGLVAPPGRDLEGLHAAAAPLVAAAVAALDAGRHPSASDADVMALYRAAALDAARGLDLAPYLVAYPRGGAGTAVDVLLGVTTQDAGERVAGDLLALHALVDLLRERYDDVVLDLGTGGDVLWHEELAARADTVLVVTGPLPDTVERVARGHARLLRATGLAPERCRLVVNHAPTDARALPPLHRIEGRFRDVGAPALAGVVAHDGDLVGRARLADPDQPLLPVLLPDGATRRGRFVRGIEDVVRHVRPGLLPERPTGLIAGLWATLTPALAVLGGWLSRDTARVAAGASLVPADGDAHGGE